MPHPQLSQPYASIVVIFQWYLTRYCGESYGEDVSASHIGHEGYAHTPLRAICLIPSQIPLSQPFASFFDALLRRDLRRRRVSKLYWP